MSELLEITMLLCFGASWPMNVIKSWRARTAKGKSVAFLCLILFGYVAGIASKLINETYIGNLVQGKYESISYKTSINRPRPKEQWFRVEGTHEPIIDRALWDRVQKMIAERAKPFKVGTIGLFAKKVRCASCGYVMRSSKSGGRHFLQCFDCGFCLAFLNNAKNCVDNYYCKDDNCIGWETEAF